MKHAAMMFLFLILTVGIALAGQESGAPQFVPVQYPGAQQTYVYGINNSGAMVGQFVNKNSNGDGFVFTDNKFFDIHVPGSIATGCQAINTAGVIVGYYQTGALYTRGFVYQNGKFANIGPPKGKNIYESVIATGINDLGQIVGYFSQNGATHAFLADGKSWQQIDVPNSTSTSAWGINNSGIIALTWGKPGGGAHSSLYNGTNFKDIDVPGASATLATGINSLGDVTVWWEDSDNQDFAAVLKAGKYTTFSAPGAASTLALGINDNDIVVGIGESTQFVSGFKLIP